MLPWKVSGVWLCFCFLHAICSPGENLDPVSPLPTFPFEQASGEPDLEDIDWGSGSSYLHLLQMFPGDSPFVTESPDKQVNCTQRFWLPPTSAICWEKIAGPEEFAKSRLLVLQNRAALQAVSIFSGVEDKGISYNHQAREEVEGIRSDHRNVVETIQTMEIVFVSLKEKRKEGEEQGVLTSMKHHLSDTKDAIDGREHMADHLEKQFSTLEKTFLNFQLRLNKLNQQ